MSKEQNNQKENKALHIGGVMPRFSVEQIESIIFDQVGDYPKKLKHIKDPHPMMNADGLMRINGEYYQWAYLNGA